MASELGVAATMVVPWMDPCLVCFHTRGQSPGGVFVVTGWLSVTP